MTLVKLIFTAVYFLTLRRDIRQVLDELLLLVTHGDDRLLVLVVELLYALVELGRDDASTSLIIAH